jgi:hypothetical protein
MAASLLGFVLCAAACEEETQTNNYNPNRAIEKVNCAGGVKCAECCNDKVCAEGQFCLDGSNDEDRVILLCDGPEDCTAPGVCCMSNSNGGALIARCSGGSTCEGLTLCHNPDNCGGLSCASLDQAPYVGYCDDGGGEG